MNNTLRLYETGDYAGLEAGGYKFYYGYEYDRTPDDIESIWGFRASKDDRVIFEIPYEEMLKHPDCPDINECGDCLLFGIGLMFLKKSESPNN